jgi:cell wall-associated NlpC family hydrolase
MRMGIVSAAKSDVGVTAYMWGGNGEDAATISNLSSYVLNHETADAKHSKEDNARRVMTRISELNAKGIVHIPLQDCSGAVIKWHKLGGVAITDRTAASLYSGSVKVTRDTVQAGDMCFRHNGTKISHVGLYIGNGRVVESIGRDSGTVETDFSRKQDGILYWTHFGHWPAVGAPESGNSGLPVDSGDPLGDTVTSIMGSVRVRDFPQTGKTIYILRKGESLEIEEYDADTGWYCVTTPKGSGFITNNPKYVSVEVG